MLCIYREIERDRDSNRATETGHTHSVPLVADVLGGEVGVGVDAGQLDAVGLGDLQDLTLDAHGGHALLVRLGQGGLELVVGRDQTLGGEEGHLAREGDWGRQVGSFRLPHWTMT